MVDIRQHWVGLTESDVRSMLIALVGLDFGPEPEKRIPDIRESRRAFAEYIADELALGPKDVALDLGSGCGFGTWWLARRAGHVHACDISPAYLSFARRECAELANVSFHHIASRRLEPIADRSIDAICSMSVFIHLNLYDIYWYFREFDRVVKPDGRIWLDIADAESLDLDTPNTNGGYFLRHAKDYDADPAALPGLMHWNSVASLVGIARHFGFRCASARNGGQILLTRPR